MLDHTFHEVNDVKNIPIHIQVVLSVRQLEKRSDLL